MLKISDAGGNVLKTQNLLQSGTIFSNFTTSSVEQIKFEVLINAEITEPVAFTIDDALIYYYETTNNDFATLFVPDIMSFNDYYPFGALVPNRSASAEKYRYGYQGSEKDDEIKGEGNSYTTHYRLLDPRVGRWLTRDPKVTAFETPYSSMSNNPILYNDRLGDSIKTTFINIGDKETYSERAFKKFINSNDGKEFLSQFASKGQLIYGVKFEKDGKLHKKGMDLEYTNFELPSTLLETVSAAKGDDDTPRGEFRDDKVNGRFKYQIFLNYFTPEKDMPDNYKKIFDTAVKNKDIQKVDNIILLSKIGTIIHESFIHLKLQTERDLGINVNKIHGMSNDHLIEHGKASGGIKSMFNQQGYDLMKGFNKDIKTGMSDSKIWEAMWNFSF